MRAVSSAVNAERQWRRGEPQSLLGIPSLRQQRSERRKAMETPRAQPDSREYHGSQQRSERRKAMETTLRLCRAN